MEAERIREYMQLTYTNNTPPSGWKCENPKNSGIENGKILKTGKIHKEKNDFYSLKIPVN